MPETKFESFIFSVIMTFIMVYAMICYNIAIGAGGMENIIFIKAFGELKIMWPAAIVLEMFVFEKPVVCLTRRVASKNTSFFSILLIRSSLTVCMMCPAMSLLAAMLFKAPQGAELSESGFRLQRSIFQWLFPGRSFLADLPADGCSVRCSENQQFNTRHGLHIDSTIAGKAE